jgi:hypothetical protein
VYAYSTLMQMYSADQQLFEKEESTIVKQVLSAIPKPAPGLKEALGLQLTGVMEPAKQPAA